MLHAVTERREYEAPTFDELEKAALVAMRALSSAIRQDEREALIADDGRRLVRSQAYSIGVQSATRIMERQVAR